MNAKFSSVLVERNCLCLLKFVFKHFRSCRSCGICVYVYQRTGLRALRRFSQTLELNRSHKDIVDVKVLSWVYSYTVAHLCGAIVPLSSFHQMATFLSRFATSYSTDFDFTFPLASPKRGLRISEERATQSFHDSSHVSETKIVLDSGFWALDSILFISGTWILVSAANICQIPDSKLSRIPESGFRIPLQGASS